MHDPPNYSSAHPVPDISHHLRLSQLVTSGRMSRNPFTMTQGPRTEGNTHMERKPQPFLPYFFTTSSRSLRPEQSHVEIQPTTSRNSKQRLTSCANSLFTLGFVSVCLVMRSSSLYIPGTIVGSFVEGVSGEYAGETKTIKTRGAGWGTGRVGYLST